MVDKAGEPVTVISKFEETIYNEKIKQWIRDDSSMNATVRSLYNIVWGQCSKLMQDKLTMMGEFDNFEARGDVTRLLKKIRIIVLQTNLSVYDALDEAVSVY